LAAATAGATVAVALALVIGPDAAQAATETATTVTLTAINTQEPFRGELSLRVDPGAIGLTQDPHQPSADAHGHRYWVLTGALSGITIQDSRPDEPGWTITGEASDLTGPGGQIPAGNVGWAPALIAPGSDAEGALQVGTAVRPVPDAGNGSGLGAPGATLATASYGTGLGTQKVAAEITLWVPATSPVGTYTGTLTLTLTSS
jgi:hypothetical protein